MTEAERLRGEAERCTRLAAATTDAEVQRRLTGLAAEYLARAQRVEAHEAARAQLASGGSEQQPTEQQPTEQQPTEQQQQQVQPKKDDQ